MVTVLGVLCVLLFGGNVFFRERARRQAVKAADARQEKLVAARGLLDSHLPADLKKAEALLLWVVAAAPVAGASAEEDDARFALAWVRAKLADKGEATFADALASLGPADVDDPGPASVHLRVWLLGRTERYDELIEVAERHRALVVQRPFSRQLWAAALERRAAARWADGDLPGALADLRTAWQNKNGPAPALAGLLLEHGLREADQPGRLVAARRAFGEARDRAPEDSRQRDEAELGVLMCQWLEDRHADVDGRLTALLDRMVERARTLGADDDTGRLRAHAGWWYLVVMLTKHVENRPQRQHLPADEWQSLLRAVDRTEQADDELGAVRMIRGYLEWSHATDAAGRAGAIRILEASTRCARGVVLPELAQYSGGAGSGLPGRPEPGPTRTVYPRPTGRLTAVDLALIEQAAAGDDAVRELLQELVDRVRAHRSGGGA